MPGIKYNNVGSYNATTVIPEFKGLMQYGDGFCGNPCYATEAKNVETKGGVLQPAAACTMLSLYLNAPIESLARLYRRWYTGQGSKEVLIAGSNGQLYYWIPGTNAWTAMNRPSAASSYASNRWSWVSYEINPEGSNSSVDVLLLSNAEDGMVMVRGDDLTVSTVTTPKKFGVIERYAERIWGGAIKDDPDTLMYSAPYDPTDWTANTEIPEDGAGEISQPSWDGDSFTALRAFGNQLIAFKRNRVWRILGTDPGEYTFKEQYGGGAPYEGTIAVDNEQILMLGDRGPESYDGLSVTPFQQEYCRNIWNRINKIEKAAAVLWHNKYYVAISLDTSTINNAVIVYNPMDGTWLFRDDLNIERFLGTEDKLYFTSSTTPGRLWEWVEDSWENTPTTAATKWVTPWNDLGSKPVEECCFDVYLLCEAASAVTLKISIQTERRTKTKSFTVNDAKQKRIHFANRGRRWRLIIETETAQSIPRWRLVSGVLVMSDIEGD